MRKWLPIVLLCAWPLAAQKYTGPRPAKPDLPYLMHADNLIPTESLEAKPDERKGEVNYVIPGANSTVRTPLASPAFLVLTDQLQADHLQLFKLQSKGDHREILVSRKNKAVARRIRLNVTKVDDNLYKIEVDEILENGEYSLSPSDSNQVFCFQVY
jgi:hypothetical protein